MAYKLITLSFALFLSTAYLLIEGYEIAVFIVVYASHLGMGAIVGTPDDLTDEDDPYDLDRYRPAIMR